MICSFPIGNTQGYIKGLNLCFIYPKPHPIKAIHALGERVGKVSLLKQPHVRLQPCRDSLPFLFPYFIGLWQENKANHLVHGCKINTHTWNGKRQFKVQWSIDPFSFLEDHSTWHLISLSLIIGTAGEGTCIAAWHVSFGWKMILIWSVAKQ